MKRERLADAALLAIPMVVAAIAAAQSWNGWLDPIVDTGRDLYLPEQLRHGVKLYRDVVYYYPPLTPYLLALLTAVTGSSLAAYTAIGSAIAAGTIVALYTIGKVACGRAAGVAAAVLFAACSVAPRSTWGTNYFFPYAHAATLGMLFFVAFVACLIVYLFAARTPGWIAAALSFALAACWTKLEYALFTAVVLAFAFAVHRIDLRWLGAFVAALGATVAGVSLFFGDAPAGRHWFLDNVAPQSLLGSEYLRAFYRAVMGLDHWPALLWRSAIAASLVFAFAALTRVPANVSGRMEKAFAIVGAVVAAAALVSQDDGFFRAWTVLQIALLGFAVRRPRDPLTLLLVVSLCATSRVFFNIVPVWYGFVFLVPLYALCACALMRFATRGLALVLIAVIAVQSLLAAHEAYEHKAYGIVTPRGTIYDALADRAGAIDELKRFAAAARMQSLVVMPEGLALNYLLRVPMPLAYYTFTPPESADPVVEQRIVEDFERKRPEWIVLVPRPLEEFGVHRFGVDYDRRLDAYLRARYRLVRQTDGASYRMIILQRVD